MLFALFSWSGRMGRLSYFGYSSLLGAVIGFLALILLLPLRNAENAAGVTATIVVILILMAVMGGFCLAAKRLHDLDLSAWYYAWIVFVPGTLQIIGLVLLSKEMKFPGLLCITFGSAISFFASVFLLLWPGTDGTNRFGERP
jgi:uncharacterized membrane protein YhaH (DUF805 family)